MLGAKTGRGFYKKEGDEILTLDLQSMEYRPRRKPALPSVEAVAGIESLPERLKMLFNSRSREAAFVSDLLTAISGYAASLVPEISDDPDAIDRAMRWGFAWETGPFELTRALKGEAVQSPSFLKKQRVIRENRRALREELA